MSTRSVSRRPIRVEAVSDLHLAPDSVDPLGKDAGAITGRADLLLLAGDFTQTGDVAEMAPLLDQLSELRGFPIAAVLGNHDRHSGEEQTIVRAFEDRGAAVLDGTSARYTVGGVSIGIAGIPGGYGGFGPTAIRGSGDPEVRALVGASEAAAARLDAALHALDCDVTIALLHYAPTRSTLAGEPLELVPFLGSGLFEHTIDRHRVDLVIHGHAHKGIEAGTTNGGVPVRNVARPVLGRTSARYEVVGSC